MKWPLFLTIPREPDFVIGEQAAPYLRRWWIIPRNKWFNIYLHQFLRDDDDRALHSHPWLFNASIILRGRYVEVLPHHIPYYLDYIGTTETVRKVRRTGRIYFRPNLAPHRVELIDQKPVWTLFITGPIVREWGFFCRQGFKHWRDFTNPADGGSTVGRGCDD